jgi:branched-chain amino acid transport system substrate-binding protein
VAKDCKALGFRSPVVISDGTLTADWLTQPNLAGTAVVGSDVSYTDDSTPAEQQFHAAIKQYQPNIGSLLGPNVVEGWVSGQLLAKAVEASGASTVTSSSIKEGLYKLKGETLGGMTPPLTYSRGKASPINCFFPETISQGQLGTPNGSTTECAPSGLVAAISAKL